MKSLKQQQPADRRRRWLGALVAALIGAGLIGSMATTGEEPPATSQPATKEIVLPVEGLSCVACVARVKKALSAMPGVSGVAVDLAARSVRIGFDSSRVSAEQIATAVERLGYKAGEPQDAPTRGET